MVVSPALRHKFVESSVKLLEDYGLDGLDIDYEYPQNDEQARGYAHLLNELRYALDQHQRRKGIDHRFLLTVFAVSLSMPGICLTRPCRLPHLVVRKTTISCMWPRWIGISTSGTSWHTITVNFIVRPPSRIDLIHTVIQPAPGILLLDIKPTFTVGPSVAPRP